jgi:hypothetical protein
VQKVGGGVDSVTATGTVVYAVAGGSIRDDGKRLRLPGPGVSDAAAEALLRIANARYGARLGVDGDESFRAHIVRRAGYCFAEGATRQLGWNRRPADLRLCRLEHRTV